MKGVFIIWKDSVTFLSHMVTFPWFSTTCTKSNNQKYTSKLEVSFCIHLLFYLWVLFIACFKCQKMKDFHVQSKRWDSLLMRKHNPSGVFVEAIIFISIYTTVFHFQLFQNLLHSQRTNNISNWSVQRYWKTEVDFFLLTIQPFTKLKPVWRHSIMMHVPTSVACIAFSLNV